MGLTLVRVAGICKFTSRLTDTQHRYLTALHLSESDLLGKTALTPNIRTTLLSGICIPKLVLKEDANERKKKGTFGQV